MCPSAAIHFHDLVVSAGNPRTRAALSGSPLPQLVAPKPGEGGFRHLVGPWPFLGDGRSLPVTVDWLRGNFEFWNLIILWLVAPEPPSDGGCLDVGAWSFPKIRVHPCPSVDKSFLFNCLPALKNI
jgi:hypothetical protein